MNYRRVPFAAHIKGDTSTGFMAGLNMTKVVLKAKAGAKPGWGGFVGWLAATHPKLYNRVRALDDNFVAAIESDHATGSHIMLSGDAGNAMTQPGKTQQFIDTVVAAGSALLSLDQQKKILKLQLDRARQGLPPVDVGAYVDPNQGVKVGLNPATQKTLLWLGGGALAAVVLSRLLGRRRR